MAMAWILGEDLGKVAEAIQIVGVARGVIDRVGGNPRLEATLEDYLGVLHLGRSEPVIARHHLERALDMRARLNGKDAQYASVLQHVAILEGHTDREKALALHHEARTILERELGLGNPETLAVYGGEGATLYELGRYREAADLLERGLATVEKSVGMDSDLAASFLTNLGLARWKLDRLPEARTTLERALAIATKRGPETPRVATLHFNLALVLWDLKQPALSRTHAVASAELYRKIGDTDGAKQAMEIVAVIDEK
jgi:eukaryotic-like serine/threonine-protein kinase